MRYVYYLLATITAVLLAGPAWHVAAHGVVSSQEVAVAPLQVAAPFPDETAFEMVGRIDHAESSITSYGFLSFVASTDQSMLSTEPGPVSAGTARFTYFARLDRLEAPAPGDVSAVNAEGTLTVYFSENGGANLDASDSFFLGTPIATIQMDLQEVLQFEQPGSGVIIGEGTLTQVIDAPFQFNGADYRFGRVGIVERFLYTGTTESDEPTPISIAGHVTVAPGADSRLPAVDAACEGAETWLAAAVANAQQAEAIVAGIPASASLQSLDPVEVSNAATGLAALADSQRAAAVPEAGTSANGLLVTALSTYSTGATLVERALEEQDGALLSQALDIIQDGSELTSRARERLAEIATQCGVAP